MKRCGHTSFTVFATYSSSSAMVLCENAKTTGGGGGDDDGGGLAPEENASGEGIPLHDDSRGFGASFYNPE